MESSRSSSASSSRGLEPLRPSSEGILINAGLIYLTLAILRSSSYMLSFWIYCTGEPTAPGWDGCYQDPPTLSTVSSYNGAHGMFRCIFCVAMCIPQAIIVWLVLRCAYCDLLESPPIPYIFSGCLLLHCLFDFAQVVTAHSTEHWIIAHMFFGSLAVTMYFFFQGVLTSPGLWGQGYFSWALLMAAFLFGGSITLMIYLFVSFEMDQNATLDKQSWVAVEYAMFFLVIGMHIFIGLAMPTNLAICTRGPSWPKVVMAGDGSESQSLPPTTDKQPPSKKQPGNQSARSKRRAERPEV